MVQRVLIGSHPLAPGTGIYATRDAFDVIEAGPDNLLHRGRFALNTRAGRMANIMQSGTCTQGVSVSHDAIGSGKVPMVMFERILGNGGFDPHEIARNLNAPFSPTALENLSRWRLVQGTTFFRIEVRAASVPDPITGASFRYTVFNLSAN